MYKLKNCALDLHNFFHYLQLVEINRTPRIKLSEDVEKVTIPGRKQAYRLFGADGQWLIFLWMGIVSSVFNTFAIFAPRELKLLLFQSINSQLSAITV